MRPEGIHEGGVRIVIGIEKGKKRIPIAIGKSSAMMTFQNLVGDVHQGMNGEIGHGQTFGEGGTLYFRLGFRRQAKIKPCYLIGSFFSYRHTVR